MRITPTRVQRAVRPGWALAALGATQFMVTLDSSIVNVAMPTIRGDLGLSAAQASWVVNAYLVAFSGLMLLGGRLADVLRRRGVFLAGMAGFVVSSVICAVAPTGDVLVAARVAQGAAGAVLAPAALAIVMGLFPAQPARGRAMAVWGGVSGAGGVAGVLLGGVLSETLGWPAIFLVNVPVGLAAAAVVLASTSPMPASGGTFDLAGAVTVTTTVGALVLAVVNGPERGWGSPATLVPLAVGLAALVAFVAAERRAVAPLVPLRTFRRAGLVTANLLMAILGGVMVGLFFLLPQYQQDVLGMSPTATSLGQLPIALAITASGFAATWVAGRIGGVRRALPAALGLLGAGLVWLSLAGSGAAIADLIAPFVLIGTGLGLTFVYVTTLAVADAGPGDAGLASGLVNTARQTGGALGLAVLVAVAVAGGTAAAPSFGLAFAAAAGLTAVALVLSLLPVFDRPDSKAVIQD